MNVVQYYTCNNTLSTFQAAFIGLSSVCYYIALVKILWRPFEDFKRIQHLVRRHRLELISCFKIHTYFFWRLLLIGFSLSAILMARAARVDIFLTYFKYKQLKMAKMVEVKSRYLLFFSKNTCSNYSGTFFIYPHTFKSITWKFEVQDH